MSLLHDDPFVITFRGRIIYQLNRHLVEQRGLSRNDVKMLQAGHVVKAGLLKEASDAFLKKDRAELQRIAAEITDIEFTLQDLWKFERDPLKHNHRRIPGCSCEEAERDVLRSLNSVLASVPSPVIVMSEFPTNILFGRMLHGLILKVPEHKLYRYVGDYYRSDYDSTAEKSFEQVETDRLYCRDSRVYDTRCAVHGLPDKKPKWFKRLAYIGRLDI